MIVLRSWKRCKNFLTKCCGALQVSKLSRGSRFYGTELWRLLGLAALILVITSRLWRHAVPLSGPEHRSCWQATATSPGVHLACRRANPRARKNSFSLSRHVPNNRFILKCAFRLCFVVSPTVSHRFSRSGFHGHFPKFPDRIRPP